MILDTIVARKQVEVEILLSKGYAAPEGEVSPPRGFRKSLIGFKGLSLIAEAKKASPSKGVICPDFDPVKIARSYEAGGAQAISVLTDEDFFQGRLSYIPLVRKAVGLPVLRKDFIINEVQIRQARDYGADAILLIAAILESAQIRDYLGLVAGLGMDALVEVHDEKELEKALGAGSGLIGINNRNLNDFTVNLETTFRLKKLVPAEIPVVSESGIRSHEDILNLAAAGVTAVLVGESLMRAADRRSAILGLMGR